MECIYWEERNPKCPFVKQKKQDQSNYELNGLLYGVVLWVNGNPTLDGMKAFSTKKEALSEADKWEKTPKPLGVTLQLTIIRIEKAI